MRTAADFTAVTRRGRRVRCGSVVVYLLADADSTGASLVGLVVGKAVGASVVRHQVSRRLRAQLSQRLDLIPNGARLVVRALPETSEATSAMLGRDLSRALDKLTLRTGAGPQRSPRLGAEAPDNGRSGSSR